MKIVNPDYMFFAPEHLQALENLGDFKRYMENPKDSKDLLKRIKTADIIINFWFPMQKTLFNQLPNLKMVCVAAAGYDWIDVKAAKAKGVVVCNCPGHNTESVAENTISLMLAAVRNLIPAYKSLYKGKWMPTAFKGLDLKGKTLGIVGYGRIGRRVAEIASKGFSMKIVYINSKSSRKDFEHLLKISDFISVNVPLTPDTRNLLGEAEFKLMKKGVVIVNTGRGAIINDRVLLKYIVNKKVRAVALDAYKIEPPKDKLPFNKFNNVICTPHISWDTEETDYYLSEMVLENIKAFLKGKPINVVS